jgi:hypothetical protein
MCCALPNNTWNLPRHLTSGKSIHQKHWGAAVEVLHTPAHIQTTDFPCQLDSITHPRTRLQQHSAAAAEPCLLLLLLLSAAAIPKQPAAATSLH